MEFYKSKKGNGIFYIISSIIAYNILIVLLIHYINSYEISIFLKTALIAFNIYEFYYLGMFLSIKYAFDDNNIYIIGLFGLRKIKVPFTQIKTYNVVKGQIKGVRISGYGNRVFALGRSIIDKIGTTHMFTTSGKEVLYLNTQGINYGISPVDSTEFIKKLNYLDISEKVFEIEKKKVVNLHRDINFIIPFVIVAVISILVTLIPIILYLTNKIPSQMPLSFDASFQKLTMGTGKDFAFKQMTYGLLNMAILFCMYYASYFYAKYDENVAYRYIYIALLTSALFLLMQFRILYTFVFALAH